MSLIRTRRWWLLAFTALFMMGAFFPLFVTSLVLMPLPGNHHLPKLLAFGLALIPLAVYWFGLQGLWNLYQGTWSTREGAVTSDANGVSIDGVRVLKRTSLRHGHIVKDGERLFLRLHRRAPFAAPYEFEVESENEARKLLADLRLDAQTSVSEFELRWRTERWAKTWGRAQKVLLVFGFVPALFALPMFGDKIGLAVWASYSLFASLGLTSGVTRVSVGADGLRLKRTLTRERFLSFAEVSDAKVDGKDLHLTLTDGTKMALHLDEEGPTLGERIREALTHYRARNANAATVVARGDRSTAEWIKDAKTIRERDVSYRQAAVPDEQLWSIVEDASASPTERAGAALALRAELDGDGRTRLRIAAGACAEKKLRVALETMTKDADDSDLEEVLEPLEDRRVMKR